MLQPTYRYRCRACSHDALVPSQRCEVCGPVDAHFVRSGEDSGLHAVCERCGTALRPIPAPQHCLHCGAHASFDWWDGDAQRWRDLDLRPIDLGEHNSPESFWFKGQFDGHYLGSAELGLASLSIGGERYPLHFTRSEVRGLELVDGPPQQLENGEPWPILRAELAPVLLVGSAGGQDARVVLRDVRLHQWQAVANRSRESATRVTGQVVVGRLSATIFARLLPDEPPPPPAPEPAVPAPEPAVPAPEPATPGGAPHERADAPESPAPDPQGPAPAATDNCTVCLLVLNLFAALLLWGLAGRKAGQTYAIAMLVFCILSGLSGMPVADFGRWTRRLGGTIVLALGVWPLLHWMLALLHPPACLSMAELPFRDGWLGLALFALLAGALFRPCGFRVWVVWLWWLNSLLHGLAWLHSVEDGPGSWLVHAGRPGACAAPWTRPALPTIPTAPGLPSLPTLPAVPGAPAQPTISSTPGAPAQQTSAPAPGAPAQPANTASSGPPSQQGPSGTQPAATPAGQMPSDASTPASAEDSAQPPANPDIVSQASDGVSGEQRVSVGQALAHPQLFLDCQHSLYFPNAALFDFDRAELRPDGEMLMAQLGQLLRSEPEAHVIITGHSDQIGDATRLGMLHNITLSNQRAASVADWQIRHGNLRRDRVQVRGAGGSFPITTDPAQSVYNRRVEIRRECPSSGGGKAAGRGGPP